MFGLRGLLAGLALIAAASLPIAATAQQAPRGDPWGKRGRIAGGRLA